MSELISVIIPIYKVEEYLDECIASVIAQTYTNLEIILVDDGSPDNCPQMCDNWAEKDSRIKVIHKENEGVSAARNAALDLATGNFIAFVDSDDWIAADMYAYLMEKAHCEEADIVSCGIAYVGNKRFIPGTKEFTGTPQQVFTMIFDDTAFSVGMWNKLYRRSLWEDVRFPTLAIGEDAVVSCRLVGKANKIVQINSPFYYYRIRENSAMTSSFSLKKMDEEVAWRCNCQFIEKCYPSLRKNAFDFYLQRVNVLIRTMSAEDQKNYAEQYRYLRKILKSNFLYIVVSSKLKWKQRIKLALDIIKL